MLRVDGSRYKPRRRRRLLLWLTLGLVVLIAALLGVLTPRGATTIEIWSGAEAAPTSCPYSGGGPPFALQSFEAHRMSQPNVSGDAAARGSGSAVPPRPGLRDCPTLTVGERAASGRLRTRQIPVSVAVRDSAWIESKINDGSVSNGAIWGTLGPTVALAGLRVRDHADHEHDSTMTAVLPSRYEALVGLALCLQHCGRRADPGGEMERGLLPGGGRERSQASSSRGTSRCGRTTAGPGLTIPATRHTILRRQPYDCDADRSDYWDYPYQERVLGCVINPPVVNGSAVVGSSSGGAARMWLRLTTPGGALSIPDHVLRRSFDTDSGADASSSLPSGRGVGDG